MRAGSTEQVGFACPHLRPCWHACAHFYATANVFSTQGRQNVFSVASAFSVPTLQWCAAQQHMASEGAQVDLREYRVLIVGDALKKRLAQRTCTDHVNYLCYLLSIRTLVRTDIYNFDCVYVNCCTGAYVCMYVCMYRSITRVWQNICQLLQ